MKYTSLILIPLLTFLISTPPALADLNSEIRGGSYCKKEIFNRFKTIEQTHHELLRFKPKRELMSLAEQMELMCPWSIQRDFNGDKIEDWVGFAKKADKFELIAYLSKGRGYSVQVLKTLDSLPNTLFLRWMQTRFLKNYTDKKLNIGSNKYALQVTKINDSTEIYLWDGKALSKILTTPQMF